MTSNKVFNKLQEQEVGMQVELGDDATYPVVEVGSISSQMPSNDILELNGVLNVLSLTKNLLSILVMPNRGHMAEFNHEVLIQRRCLDPSRVLDKDI